MCEREYLDARRSVEQFQRAPYETVFGRFALTMIDGSNDLGRVVEEIWRLRGKSLSVSDQFTYQKIQKNLLKLLSGGNGEAVAQKFARAVFPKDGRLQSMIEMRLIDLLQCVQRWRQSPPQKGSQDFHMRAQGLIERATTIGFWIDEH